MIVFLILCCFVHTVLSGKRQTMAPDYFSILKLKNVVIVEVNPVSVRHFEFDKLEVDKSPCTGSDESSLRHFVHQSCEACVKTYLILLEESNLQMYLCFSLNHPASTEYLLAKKDMYQGCDLISNSKMSVQYMCMFNSTPSTAKYVLVSDSTFTACVIERIEETEEWFSFLEKDVIRVHIIPQPNNLVKFVLEKDSSYQVITLSICTRKYKILNLFERCNAMSTPNQEMIVIFQSRNFIVVQKFVKNVFAWETIYEGNVITHWNKVPLEHDFLSLTKYIDSESLMLSKLISLYSLYQVITAPSVYKCKFISSKIMCMFVLNNTLIFQNQSEAKYITPANYQIVYLDFYLLDNSLFIYIQAKRLALQLFTYKDSSLQYILTISDTIDKNDKCIYYHYNSTSKSTFISTFKLRETSLFIIQNPTIEAKFQYSGYYTESPVEIQLESTNSYVSDINNFFVHPEIINTTDSGRLNVRHAMLVNSLSHSFFGYRLYMEQKQVVTCPAGFMPLKERCRPCPKGHYSTDFEDNCVPCPPKHTTLTIGSVGKSLCHKKVTCNSADQLYSYISNRCVPAYNYLNTVECLMPGYYINDSTKECEICPADSFCAGHNQIQHCGYYYDRKEGKTQFFHCFKNSDFTELYQQKVCFPIQFWDGNNCVSCLDGFICKGGMYGPLETCPLMETNSDDYQYCVCLKGFYRDPLTKSCRACDFGTYKEEKGDQACTKCPSGSIGLYMGAVSRTACVCTKGYIMNKTKLECELCPKNFYCKLVVERNSVEEKKHFCGKHAYTKSKGASSISDCLCKSGFYFNSLLERCLPCENATINFSQNQCSRCPPKSLFQKTAGNTIQCVCMPDYYKEYSSKNHNVFTCIHCTDTNYYCPGNDLQMPCPPGRSISWINSDSFSSEMDCLCPVNQELIDGKCQPCRTGFTKRKVGNMLCKQNCPDQATANGKATNRGVCHCIKGYFFAHSTRLCQPCPEGAICLGGLTFEGRHLAIFNANNHRFALHGIYHVPPVPMASYGSVNNEGRPEDILFLNCGSSCLGNNICSRGYTGPLCQKCSVNYTRLINSNTVQCTSCESKMVMWINFIKISTISFGCFVLSIFIVSNGFDRRSVQSIVLKAMLHFVTKINIFMKTKRFYTVQQWITEMSSSPTKSKWYATEFSNFQKILYNFLFSMNVDCLYYRLFNPESDTNILFMQMFLYLIYPFLVLFYITIISYAMIVILRIKKRQYIQTVNGYLKENPSKAETVREQRFLAVLRWIPISSDRFYKTFYNLMEDMMPIFLVVTYIFFPFTLQETLQQLECVTIHEKFHLIADLSIECSFKDIQYRKLFLLNSFVIIVWTLVYPIFVFILLFRTRFTLSSPSNRLCYGFLTNGYKHRYYFWEVVKHFQSAILLLISSSSSIKTKNNSINGDTKFCFLVIFGILFNVFHHYFQPYDEREYSLLGRIEGHCMFAWTCYVIMMAIKVYNQDSTLIVNIANIFTYFVVAIILLELFVALFDVSINRLFNQTFRYAFIQRLVDKILQKFSCLRESCHIEFDPQKDTFTILKSNNYANKLCDKLFIYRTNHEYYIIEIVGKGLEEIQTHLNNSFIYVDHFKAIFLYFLNDEHHTEKHFKHFQLSESELIDQISNKVSLEKPIYTSNIRQIGLNEFYYRIYLMNEKNDMKTLKFYFKQ